ncbi:MAG: flagellar protein FlaG [Planctomycetes bacterium]|nr:flagellar protein FlaG [Planctomycetota bacterium]
MTTGMDGIPTVKDGGVIVSEGRTGVVKSGSPTAPAARRRDDGGDSAPGGQEVLSQTRARNEETADSVLEEIVESTNSSLQLLNRSLRFRVHRDSDELQVQVVDTETDRVIRSIPSDEMLDLATRMRELSGLGAMVDSFR